MDKDEIIRMAREAGFQPSVLKELWSYGYCCVVKATKIERFAALVAEPWIETNKALAKEIIELKKQVDISALPIIIEAAVKEAVLAEREACAKVCDEGWKEGIGEKYQGDVFAAAIRARGEE